MVTDKAAMTPERSDARRNLVTNAALLWLIDPVRGEPINYSLEGHPDDEFLRSHQLKERFLDSFALICSTSACGKDTASAVCIEQHQQSATILRVARNRGLSERDRIRLNTVLQILTAAAHREKTALQTESELLAEVVSIDEGRILSLLEKLEKDGLRRVFELAISRLSSNYFSEDMLRDSTFEQWIKSCPFLATSPNFSAGPDLISLVRWASQARWTYPMHLHVLLNLGSSPDPPYMQNLHKIARYWGGIKSMVKFAIKTPEVFASIRIEDIQCPAQETFSLVSKKTHLRNALMRLVRQDCDMTMIKLAQRWDTDDAEAELRKACRLKLTLHAEMQLLDFYDRNPTLVPQLLFMGTSKKACYLCHEFLRQHPLKFRVSACHQKIYPTWMPPSSRGVSEGDRRELLWTFSEHIGQVTARELRTGLDAPKRPRSKDSTAGPSLTVTATVSTEA